MEHEPNKLFALQTGEIHTRVQWRDAHLEIAPETVSPFSQAATWEETGMFVGQPFTRLRYFFLASIIGLILGGCMIRILWMNVYLGSQFARLADRNRIRMEILPARRGIIRDRNGIVLADNIPSFDLHVTPWLFPADQNQREILIGKISRAIGMSTDDVSTIIASSTNPGRTFLLKHDLSYDVAIRASVAIGVDPSFRVVATSKRRYPFSTTYPSYSHILGYVGSVSPEELQGENSPYIPTDSTGKTGIEKSAEVELRGISGIQKHEVDALNHESIPVGFTDPKDGEEVVLEIDAKLQEIAERALQDELTASHKKAGVVVALDPRDGSVRALVSLPSYDDNDFSGTVSSTLFAKLISDESHPLLSRAFSGIYPSGSTIKPVVATAALAEHIITPETSFLSTGGVHLGNAFFPDWKAGGHGITNVRKAIAWSVNTFFYYIGGGHDSFAGLGVDRLSSWMKKFGFGSKTGIDLPGEAAGFVPTKEWKQDVRQDRWYVGDTYNLSIGQGDLLVTPLQIANMTGEIANGGYRITPHVLSTTTELGERLADADAIQTVQEGMRQTVTSGSGRALSSLPFSAAGKTGTAQWRKDRSNHAWFTSFAPYEKPEIVVTVFIEEGVEGSAVSVPVAKQILTAWWARRQKNLDMP